MNIDGVLSSVASAKVLVVDDNTSNTRLIERVLSRAGLLDVIATNDSREVTSILVESQPDLVILDLHMPHLDGFQLLEIISEYAKSQFLPVVVLTADTTQAAIHRALGLGAHDFLTKPLDATEVALRTRNLLRTRLAYQALRRGNAEMREHLGLIQNGVRESWTIRFSRIEELLRSDEPKIVYQPIVQLAGGEQVGYEALSRFGLTPHKSPNLWFDEANGVGLGIELELKALNLALDNLNALPKSCFLSLNVSPDVLSMNLTRYLPASVDWERIVLEVTEHTSIDDYASIKRMLSPLRNRGARLATDDTGAGYASMRHILELNPDIIKVDISITRAIDKDPSRRALASALAAFASHIDAKLVAEGIETPEELEVLREIGVDYGQGFLLGRPAPIMELVETT